MLRYPTTIVLGAAVLLLAACGSSSNPGNTDPITAKQQSTFAFSSCMRSHGVPNFPDLGGNGNAGFQITASRRAGSGTSMTVNGVPVNAPAFQSAMQACRSHLPNGGQPPQLSAARRNQMLQYSECMRTHGVPGFPDPTFGAGGGAQLRLPGNLTPQSPAFQAAQRSCGKLFGGAGAVKVAAP